MALLTWNRLKCFLLLGNNLGIAAVVWSGVSKVMVVQHVCLAGGNP